MHRIGYLRDQMISPENCIRAERRMAKNKRKNRMARHVASNAKRFGLDLSEKLRAGYRFHPYREKVIKDSYKGKERGLKIPNIEDQAAMQAWLNIAEPIITKMLYYYSCGSVPKAGQLRATKALQKWLRGERPAKWAASLDIRHFYDTCPHSLVLRGLRRIFKDEAFITFAADTLRAMSATGVGLAIGYPVSHWFANVALMEIDHEVTRRFPDVHFVRYMDDMALASRNKRHLRWAFDFIRRYVADAGMEIKRNWQIYPIAARGIAFLSYRFYHGYTILLKPMMYRIARKARKYMTLHNARAMISYKGVLKYCNSFNFRTERICPFVNFRRIAKLISGGGKQYDDKNYKLA